MGRWWERLRKKQEQSAAQEPSFVLQTANANRQSDRKVEEESVVDDSSKLLMLVMQDDQNGEKRDEGKGLEPPEPEVREEDYKVAVAECNRAMVEWKNALHKLDWVVEPDQIDYAIYSVIAAEKHYSTLLKETKRMHKRMSKVKDA